MGPYDLGAAVPPGDLQFVVTDDGGNPVDASPDPPVLTITLPDATTATPAVTQQGTGTYVPASHFLTTQAGHHLWAWTVAGEWPGAYVDSFEVRPSPDPTIISLAEARDILKMGSDTSRDGVIRAYSQAITEWIEYTVGPVVTRQVTETVRSQGRVMILGKPPVRTDLGTALNNPDRRDGSTSNGLVSVTPLMTYGFMYDLDQLLVTESGEVRHYAGFPFFYSGDPYPQYEVVYWAGRKVIPWGIYEAHKIALKHVWAVERGSASGAAGAATYGESETTVTGYGFAVPNRAIELLTPHMGSASKAAFA
jgi:hypothetical protein